MSAGVRKSAELHDGRRLERLSTHEGRRTIGSALAVAALLAGAIGVCLNTASPPPSAVSATLKGPPGSAAHATHRSKPSPRAHHPAPPHGARARSPHPGSGNHARRPRPAPGAISIGDRGDLALRFALAQIGKPYVYGGNGPDAYDCSGLTQQAWRAAGVSIPRTTQAQAYAGAPVPRSGIRPGDLVIFYPDASHVGIYAGDGKVVVAPHSGAVITLQPMTWMPVFDIRRPG
jgi:cell wall-associated NlpC family hydrolase